MAGLTLLDRYLRPCFVRAMSAYVTRAVASAVILSLALVAVQAPAFAQSDRAAWRETRRLCPGLRDLDFARLAVDPEDNWREEARSLLRATGQPQLGDAEVVLRFHARPGFGGGGSTTRTTARRVGGEWIVRREDALLTTAGPPPYDRWRIDMRASRPQSPIIVREGPLDADRGAALDAALADPCLAREPDVSPAALPLRGGRLDICRDGVPFFLQIERVEGVRTIVHVCQPRWRAGEIIRTLESAPTVAGRSTETRSLTPLVLVDAQGHNVPEAEAPPPVRLTVAGEHGGRAIRVALGTSMIHDEVPAAGPEGVTWTIWPPLGEPAPRYRVSIADCPDEAAGALPAPGGALRLAIRGCRIETGDGS